MSVRGTRAYRSLSEFPQGVTARAAARESAPDLNSGMQGDARAQPQPVGTPSTLRTARASCALCACLDHRSHDAIRSAQASAAVGFPSRYTGGATFRVTHPLASGAGLAAAFVGLAFAAALTQVVAFLEVDAKKIAHGAYHDHASGRRIAIVHFAQASRAAAPTGNPGAALHPIITCVKSGLHSGFEENLASLGLHEGTDYVFFN